MDIFVGEWLNLLLRWAHMIVAIGWIGTSFYFMALDYSLSKRERMNPGVLGTTWQVHGGGFYHVEKYTVAPATLPEVLHWFKWEAYLTWVTGFGLLIVQYYYHAEAFLIDPGVMPLQPWQAITISIASLAAGWFAYDLVCRSKIGDNVALLALTVFALILIAAVLYTKVFSGRGAFTGDVGSLIGTIMAVNVFGVIILNQKKMIAQMIRGETPEARYGVIGKQRSIHNNYLTLPVLLMMVSQHYPFLFTHQQSWMVVALILLSGGCIRHMLNLIDAGEGWNRYSLAAAAAVVVLSAAIYLTAPQSRVGAGGVVTDAQALAINAKHCVSCHSHNPSHPAFKEPPKNVALDTIAEMRRFAQQIYMQTVQNRAMPLGNQTGMTEEEREELGRWVNRPK